MATETSNQFQFTTPGSAAILTVLNAVLSDFAYGRHAHEEMALGVTREGVQEFTCQGRYFRSRPGDIIVFNPGDVHDGNPGNHSALRYTMLYLDHDAFLSLLGSAAQGRKRELRIKETHFQDPILRRLILQLAGLATGKGGAAFEYDYLLYEIARRLTQRMGVFQPDAWTLSKDAALLRAREYIHDNIELDISIDALSRVANMSKYHFIRLFRSQFGLTPHRYILNHRINRARDLLARGESATRAAHELGFCDASHMNRLFKRSFGVTPSQYRNQLVR